MVIAYWRTPPLKRALFFSLCTILLPLQAPAQNRQKQAEVKIQRTSLTKDQEIELGRQAAAGVEKQMEVLKNQELEAWLNRVGQQLARTPQANAYPYYFRLVNEDSINAFALPGGPMFVHTGLIKAADNEAEVVGVLAHEMSHVALRHSAAQIGKQQTWGTLFGVLGAAAGALTGGTNGCGALCQVAETGIGLGGTTVLMKFSRGFERDADLNGARMMAAAGYDPIQLAKFFEKLEAQAGAANEPKGLQMWLSSHPTSGSRVQYVSEDIRYYAKSSYNSSTGNFARVKQLVARIPPPKPKPAALLQAKQGNPRGGLPQDFADYQAAGFSIGYPSGWQAGQAQAGGSVYLTPQGGVTKSASGVELILGAMVDYYQPANGGVALDATTSELLQSLEKGDANLRAERSSRTEVGRKPALLTRVSTRTSLQNEPNQTIFLYTVAREAGLWYVVFAAPASRVNEYEPLFRTMAQTIQFPD